MRPKHFYSIKQHGKNHIQPTGNSLEGGHKNLNNRYLRSIFLEGVTGLPLYYAYLT